MHVCSHHNTESGIFPLPVAHAEAVQLGDRLGTTVRAPGKHGAEPDPTETQESRKLGHETCI